MEEPVDHHMKVIVEEIGHRFANTIEKAVGTEQI